MPSIRVTGSTLAALTLLSMPAHAKNVLVIIGDDIAIDKVSSYAGDYPGYAPAYRPDTTAIDSLANAGLRFTRAWATPVCSPTRVSFQTGQHPFRTDVGTALGGSSAGVDPAAHLMLAESFTAQGYATAFIGKWHSGTEDAGGNVGDPATSPFFVEPHPVLSGWRRFYGIYDGYPGFGRSFTDWPRVGWVGGPGGTGYAADEFRHHTNRTSAVTLSWINQQTEPWLAVAAFSAPHSPDTASSSWTYGDADTSRYRTPSLSCLASSSCGDEALSVYQGLAEHVDLEIEDLLNGIPDTVMDDTIIVFFGDNGTPIAVQEDVFYNNAIGGPGAADDRGKGSVYENGIRVPMIVADGATWRTGAAGIIDSPGRPVDIAASSTDIYQTLHNELFMLSVAGVDSTSFVDCFTNTDVYCGFTERRYGYSELYVAGASIVNGEVAVRYGHDKMVAEYDGSGACLEETFYRTDSDPHELAPQAWVGIRAQRLRDYFINLHTPDPTSWAFANGPIVPFCP